MANVEEAPRARPAARDVVALCLLVAGAALVSVGGWTISVTVGLFVTGAACVLVAVLLGMG